jgi:NAD(P)-dependent dehydrogenase (short-subunit alcohol dehydrogenase family)
MRKSHHSVASTRLQIHPDRFILIELAGKVALVTGGSRGIGRAIVETLAEAGASVVLHYGKSARAARQIAAALGRSKCLPIAADLGNSNAIVPLWNEAMAAFGGIDILVNNASVRPIVDPLASHEVWNDSWEQVLRVNLISPAHLCRMAVQHFIGKGGGRIINLASRPAFRGDTPNCIHDGAAKGGLVSLTRSIARWHGKDNVLAYVVVPGMIRTRQLDEFIAVHGEEYALHDVPLGEFGEPQDIANVVAFLASDRARYATGATIHVNGASYVG